MTTRKAASDKPNETQLLQTIAKRSEEIDRALDFGGARRISCPRCGASFLSRKDANRSICPCCGEPLDLRRLMAEAAMRAAGFSGSYESLLDRGARNLREQNWEAAGDAFAEACAVDSKNGNAWYGLLLARTRQFSSMEKQPPDELAANVARTLNSGAAEFNERWRQYKLDCESYFETQERIRKERVEAATRARREAEAERKKAAEKRREERRQARRDPGRKTARRNVASMILWFIGVGLFIVFAVVGLGSVAIGILLVAGMFGGDNRRGRR